MDEVTLATDRVSTHIKSWLERVNECKADGHYFFNRPIEDLQGGARVRIGGRDMLMFASYGYLGLIGHPRINAAAKAAIDRYGTGTHGSRLLAGSLVLHKELEESIAQFKHAEDAITFASGYATNVTAVSTLVSSNDVVISDKFNHASIVDGCLLSGAKFVRFRHNNMADLKRCLERSETRATKLVVVDAVFSMDGDIVNLPCVAELCRSHGAWLMVDEAHANGMLGRTGRGIEEHFGLENVIDVKMGTLSKAIPSVGGYLAGKKGLIHMFRHASRAFIFASALPPPQAAAAKAAIDIILAEPERVAALTSNSAHFRRGLKELGFDTMLSETAIVPILCGTDTRAYQFVCACQHQGVFVLPVVSPAVPSGTARLRATVTAVHTKEDIDRSLGVFEKAGKVAGIIP